MHQKLIHWHLMQIIRGKVQVISTFFRNTLQIQILIHVWALTSMNIHMHILPLWAPSKDWAGLGMTIRVLGNPRVLHPTDASSGAFLHPWPKPDPRRTGFWCEFHFLPVGAPETKKNSKPKRNPKKLKTWKKPKRKLKKPRKRLWLRTPAATRESSPASRRH